MYYIRIFQTVSQYVINENLRIFDRRAQDLARTKLAALLVSIIEGLRSKVV